VVCLLLLSSKTPSSIGICHFNNTLFNLLYNIVLQGHVYSRIVQHPIGRCLFLVEFITDHIIHRFGILQTLTTDQGASFMSKEVCEFAELYIIKLLNSSPYYAQANGHAESSNRILINLIKRRYLIILSTGIRFCLKLYRLIEYLNTGLLKYLRLSLSMGRK
jgi:transposase InsO family protein